MAVQKILTIHETKCGKKYSHLENAINYISNKEKTEGGKNIFGINCNKENALQEMLEIKKAFDKTDQRQGYHFIVSFSPDDNVSPEMCNEITKEFCERYFQNRFQVVVATHNDKPHLHSHVIFNSVSMVDGKKYRYEKGDWKKIIMPILNDLCEKYGLSTLSLEDKEEEIFSDNKYNPAKKVVKGSIEREIDGLIMKSYSYNNFLSLMKDAGYKINFRGNTVSITPPGWKKNCRLKSLGGGKGYSLEEIKQRIEDKNKYQSKEKVFIKTGTVISYSSKTIIGLKKTWAKKNIRILQIGNSSYRVTAKYYETIKQINKTMEELEFLRRNNIDKKSSLKNFLESNTRFLTGNNKEKKKTINEKKDVLKLSSIVEEMEKLYPRHLEFLKGDNFFEDDHKKYVELEEELKKKKIKPDKIKEKLSDLGKKHSEIMKKEKKIKKDERLGKSCLYQLEEELKTDTNGRLIPRDKKTEKEKDI